VPITITLPDPVDVIGPGVKVFLQSDFIGPLPAGSAWLLHTSTDPEFVQVNYEERWHAEGTSLLATLASPYQQVIFPGDDSYAAGTTVHVEAQLIQAPFTVIDSGTTTATWQPTQDLWQVTRQIKSDAGLGLTTDQAQQLADDHAALNPPLLAQDGTPITGAVGDLIVRPSLKFIGIDTTTYVLTGQGTLEIPNLLGVQTGWGLILDVLEYEPGSSYMPGYVRSFHKRAGQFLLLWPARNTAEAMVIDELRLHLEHFTWLWDWAYATAVAYYIEPGWTVQARFASAFFP
jgi:hypothetical protein